MSLSGACTVQFTFDNSYARLPERFYARVNPTPVPAPRLIKINTELARNLGLDPEELAKPPGGGDSGRQPGG